MKALVTGGTGFIGRCVVDFLLAGGHSVRIISRKPGLPEGFSGKDVTVIRGDLEDPESVLGAMAGIDVFYHIGEIKNTSPRAAKKNVKLMERVTGHLGAAGMKRIVFVSSITVAGIPGSMPATEETSPLSLLKDPYTQYKEQCEKLLSENAAGIEYAVVRPGIVYGPGSRYLSGVISTIDHFGTIGIPFIGRGRSVAPLVYVKDLARAVYLAGIEDAAAGRIFNITDGAKTSWSDFLHAIGKALGKEIRLLPIPPLFFSVPARFIDLFTGLVGATMSVETYVTYFTTDLLFDNSKAQRYLRWTPDYSLTQGVEEMVLEYKAQRGTTGT
jgi:UDP-N-acetyl-alpha-D-quinovosamine dehydrogenase